MFELMYEHQGIGLAAPQVGWNARVFVVNIDIEDHDPELERVFIDPQLSHPSQPPEEGEEGCLSLPGLRLEVDRTPQVNVKATGVDGEQFVLETEGILARCIQHENDHLDGILITARVSTLQRIAVDGALREMREDWQQREEES
jgi:peptide deformylase